MVLRVLLFCALLGCFAVGAESASAQQGNYGQGNYGQGNYGQGGANYARGQFNNYGYSGYQRFTPYRSNYRGRYGYGYPGYAQNYNYSNYTRPYPYHLDYYRMKYGGSYEPYAGNIYGPPLVQQQFVAPDYGVTPYAAPQVVPQSFGSPYYPAPLRNYSGAYYW